MTLEWKELQGMSAEDLKRELARLCEQVRATRFRISQNQEKKVREQREQRKTIARILTILKKTPV